MTTLKTRSEAIIKDRIYVRKVQSSDKDEFISLAREGRTFHDPWISPPLTPNSFKLYLQRTKRDDHVGLLLCLKTTDQIVGVININNIIRGTFLSASLGYYVARQHAAQGYMIEGLELVKQYAFHELGLHRIEANIQSDNERSKNLVKRAGFKREGNSKAFLFINGAWRDHERWTVLDQRSSLSAVPLI